MKKPLLLLASMGLVVGFSEVRASTPSDRPDDPQKRLCRGLKTQPDPSVSPPSSAPSSKPPSRRSSTQVTGAAAAAETDAVVTDPSTAPPPPASSSGGTGTSTSSSAADAAGSGGSGTGSGGEGEEVSTAAAAAAVAKTYHRRLLLGEADFSYTRALLAKHEATHPTLGEFIIATELEPEGKLLGTYPDSFPVNVSDIRGRGVKVEFGVDCRQVATRYKGQHFHRIHFNFPHDRSNYVTSGSMADLILTFFQQASLLQKQGSRIHLVIPMEPGKRYLYQMWCRIYEASTENDYYILRKRRFTWVTGDVEQKRYPLYVHRQTGHAQSIEAAKYGYEFVFQKGLEAGSRKAHTVRRSFLGTKEGASPHYTNVPYYSDLVTDGDSSDYFLTEEE